MPPESPGDIVEEEAMKQYPSIFNDVIGPVMVGQSSSHTAASVRIGNVIRQLAGNDAVKKIKFAFDTEGSLATTYNHQGSDIGLLAGLLGFETYDLRIPDAYRYADEAGMDYLFEVKNIGPGHPNAYYINFTSSAGRQIALTAVSSGGGMIEIIDYMGFPVSIDGGFYETLIVCDSSECAAIADKIRRALTCEHTLKLSDDKDGKSLINIKSEEEISSVFTDINAQWLKPIMPVMSQIHPLVPFVTCDEIEKYIADSKLPLWELAVIYESQRSGLSAEAVIDRMMEIVKILKKSLSTPLDKHDKKIDDRILQNQSHLIDENSKLLGGSFNANVIRHVTRFMDIKTSMGVFVAAPTAGSCGCLSGTVFALAEELGLEDAEVAKAMLSAGLIGVIIAYHSTFAAEVCGCQAECGAGSGMCAAACVEILKGTAKQSFSAASMALQNIFGMVCDPVANKVEVPCLGKNILCAFNAIAGANMAMSGFDEVIPLDETIIAMDSVGRAIPRELRCTGLGGLSVTKTSLRILAGKDGFA